jgi:hypothetical protein
MKYLRTCFNITIIPQDFLATIEYLEEQNPEIPCSKDTRDQLRRFADAFDVYRDRFYDQESLPAVGYCSSGRASPEY